MIGQLYGAYFHNFFKFGLGTESQFSGYLD